MVQGVERVGRCLLQPPGTIVQKRHLCNNLRGMLHNKMTYLHLIAQIVDYSFDTALDDLDSTFQTRTSGPRMKPNSKVVMLDPRIAIHSGVRANPISSCFQKRIFFGM
jgi:hypothetical protein